MAEVSHSTRLQLLLEQLQAGQDQAREQLIQNSLERFREQTRKMFPRRGPLRRLDETDDILQKAMLRLHRALVDVRPPDVRAYLGLASRQIRWVILDLAKQVKSRPPFEYMREQEGPADNEGEPSSIAEWTEFHTAIDRLPDDARELFDLLFYEGMTLPDAAALLGVPLRTFNRRWRKAKLLLRDALKGESPSMSE